MKKGRGGGCRKTSVGLEGPETKQAASPPPTPHAGLSPTKSGGAADKLRAALGQSQVPQPWRPHLGGIRSGPGHGHHYGYPVRGRDKTPELQQPAQPGHSAGGGGGGASDPDAGLRTGDTAAGKRTISGLRRAPPSCWVSRHQRVTRRQIPGAIQNPELEEESGHR